MRFRPIEERFWEKVWIGPDCWIWTACRNKKGYGRLNKGGMAVLAHRLSWELHFGAVPDGLHVLHSCDQPCCVNPGHLWLGTDQDNVSDRDRKGRHVALKGEKNGSAKLTLQEALAIRKMPGTQKEVAAIFGINQSHVHRIRSGQNWKEEAAA